MTGFAGAVLIPKIDDVRDLGTFMIMRKVSVINNRCLTCASSSSGSKLGGLGFRFLVCENKIFAGREQRAEGEALGRPLAVAWFEKHSSCAQGDILRPVAGHEQQTLALQSTSVAELLRAAGHFVEVAVGTNERDHEVLLESCFLNYSLNNLKRN